MRKINIILILNILLLLNEGFTQTFYEVMPGTKGNEIKLTVANISEKNPAGNVIVALSKKSTSLNFNKAEETIAFVEANTETEVSFRFDVNRNAPINKKDTINFMLSSPDGILMTKQFIFSYIGPKEFKLEQNFPNPFNPVTTIQYQLPQDARVILKVYDILGSEVTTLVNEEQAAGYKEIKFNASNLASGMYIYRIQADKFVSVKKMMVLK